MVNENDVDEETSAMPKSAEDGIKSAEDEKMSAEDGKKSAEDEKMSAEDGIKSAEDDLMIVQEKLIYNYVKKNEMITSSIVCDILDIKERRSRDILSEMCKKKYLKKQGATANLKYVLNDIVD